ncbi:Dolichyl-diphosphooligosaccharide--protein glycosyltransferase subunit 1 [Acrodontium crateriforme]|uniref:Dolichyl-diphosphooligosaccharide--protein glycosyltransferase subunit 1 n=1 Tax=Acrodontium crateriforme TaxID=150365 RepID=A0AAQ3MCP4_9PEZI|nr:Dolichyl-diphosphooligosaccharide--protein glycosyltransferase subunit 1 [Acrodontium crateriforme]
MRLLLPWALLGSAVFSLADPSANAAQDSQKTVDSAAAPPQHFRNINLVRNINLEKSYARETINVVVENIDSKPQSEYYFPFERGQIKRIGGLEAKDKKQPERTGFTAEIAALDQTSATEYYKITFPAALKPNEQITLSITYVSLQSLDPLPAKIEQSDKQYVRHGFSAYAPSAYTTLKQKTKLKLPTTDVPDAVKLAASLNAEGKEDPQRQGTTFTYGPYGELPAGAVEEVSVRYEFTKPLTHSTRLERDIEVSHWGGNIAFEERHWLTNRAAELKNQFSRVIHQQLQYYNPPTSALKELKFPLAVGSMDPYFTDDIGNVSTSRFRSNAREANLELKPRYPLFGKWNYSFRVGWNADLAKYLRGAGGDKFVLKVPFFEGPKQAEGVAYEKVITRVILPEGSTNVEYTTSLPLVDESVTKHYTFMDTAGRTMLELTALNVVDDQRDIQLVISYDYPFAARFRKPISIFAAVAAVFAITAVVRSLDVSIGRKTKSS